MLDDDPLDPNRPVKWDGPNLPGAYAVQCCYAGTATPEQQTLAIEFIVSEVASYYDVGYRQNPYDQAMIQGRRFVGAQVVKFTKMNYDAILGAANEISKQKQS